MPNNLFEEQTASAVDTALAKEMRNPGADRDTELSLTPWNQGGGFGSFNLSLANLTGNGVSLNVRGYEIHYVAPVSTAGGILILNDQIVLTPGMRVRGFFENVRVRLGNATDGASFISVAAGNAYLVLHKMSDLHYREDCCAGAGAGMVLLAQEAVVQADVTAGGTFYFGPDNAGGFNIDAASEANVNQFDVRRFGQAEVFWTGTFANAVTLNIQLAHYIINNGTESSLFVTSATTAANGGTLSMHVGAPLSQAPGAGGLEWNSITVKSNFFSPAFRVRFTLSGAPGVITNGRLAVYGLLSH